LFEWFFIYFLLKFPHKNHEKMKKYLLNFIFLSVIAFFFRFPQVIAMLRSATSFLRFEKLSIGLPDH
jgi:hypothetical protein